MFACPVSAGFPSPADDYIETRLDLNRYLIRHPSATFFVRVSGDSMINAGIHDGDILVVDRAVEPANNHVVLAIVDGEFTVKRLRRHGHTVQLIPENDAYPVIDAAGHSDLEVWGVVTAVVHKV